MHSLIDSNKYPDTFLKTQKSAKDMEETILSSRTKNLPKRVNSSNSNVLHTCLIKVIEQNAIKT